LLVLVLLLTLSSCASKPTTSTDSVVYGPPPPGTPITQESSPEIKDSQRGQVGPVTLVLGGAGVSSFATVGILKRFKQEGIRVERVICTGWPCLFSLAYGYLKSIHDVEWFSMRLSRDDLYSLGFLESEKDFAKHDRLSKLVKNSFRPERLEDSKVPIVISAANTDLGEAEVFDQGSWIKPLLITMSVPGIYRPYQVENQGEWIQSLRGLDVEEAVKRDSTTIVAFEMYGDYLQWLGRSGDPSGSSETVFRRVYAAQLKRSLSAQIKEANVAGSIQLHRSPTDFSSKRAAILAGYKEASKVIQSLRNAR